jgi:hypothetical protein
MLAHAFLADGSVSYPSGFAWPRPAAGKPGAWVTAGVDAAPDVVRGCRSDQLPYWLDAELWEIELDGQIAEDGHALLGERGRLRARQHGWTDEAAWDFVEACAFRVRDRAAGLLESSGRAGEARELGDCADLPALEGCGSAIGRRGQDEASRLAGFAADVGTYARESAQGALAAGVSAYIAAHALAGGDKTAAGYDERFAAERAWQAAWLADRLGL